MRKSRTASITLSFLWTKRHTWYKWGADDWTASFIVSYSCTWREIIIIWSRCWKRIRFIWSHWGVIEVVGVLSKIVNSSLLYFKFNRGFCLALGMTDVFLQLDCLEGGRLWLFTRSAYYLLVIVFEMWEIVVFYKLLLLLRWLWGRGNTRTLNILNDVFFVIGLCFEIWIFRTHDNIVNLWNLMWK